MKINPASDLAKGVKAEGTPVNGRAGPNGAKTTAPVADSANVQLSPLSAQLGTLATSLATSGDFDQAKVDAIKQAIVDGQLHVNAEVVADKMLTSLRDMFSHAAKS